MLNFIILFVDVDDCWKNFEKIHAAHRIVDCVRKRNRDSNLSIRELMTILIALQTSGKRTFKSFYRYLLKHLKLEFPALVSYDQFIFLFPRAVIALFVYLQTRVLGSPGHILS